MSGFIVVNCKFIARLAKFTIVPTILTVKMQCYFNPSLVTIVAAQCLPYGKQRMCTPVQPY